MDWIEAVGLRGEAGPGDNMNGEGGIGMGWSKEEGGGERGYRERRGTRGAERDAGSGKGRIAPRFALPRSYEHSQFAGPLPRFLLMYGGVTKQIARQNARRTPNVAVLMGGQNGSRCDPSLSRIRGFGTFPGPCARASMRA